MFIVDINSISAADMDFRVDLFLHMRWGRPKAQHCKYGLCPKHKIVKITSLFHHMLSNTCGLQTLISPTPKMQLK
ncbi:hypothetical protein SK128_011017 [Halocaridina rubra]|uniref:Uncharacterized protein n=1 Tax=Halocaridina rubra TaxID=373956 RepID=A0AAN8XFI9_HALRR